MPVLEQKRKCNLILHCGATAVPRVEVERVSTPRGAPSAIVHRAEPFALRLSPPSSCAGGRVSWA